MLGSANVYGGSVLEDPPDVRAAEVVHQGEVGGRLQDLQVRAHAGLETAAIKFLNALTKRATAKVLAARIEPVRAA